MFFYIKLYERFWNNIPTKFPHIIFHSFFGNIFYTKFYATFWKYIPKTFFQNDFLETFSKRFSKLIFQNDFQNEFSKHKSTNLPKKIRETNEPLRSTFFNSIFPTTLPTPYCQPIDTQCNENYIESNFVESW